MISHEEAIEAPQFKLGQIVEYHPSAWMQREAGHNPIEIVEIVGFTHDGGISYSNKKLRGTIGSEAIHKHIKIIENEEYPSKGEEYRLNM